MNSKYQEVDKEAVINRHIMYGESVATIVADTGIPRSTIYDWIRHYNEPKDDNKKISLRHVQHLKKKIERLENIIEILKKTDCVQFEIKIKNREKPQKRQGLKAKTLLLSKP